MSATLALLAAHALGDFPFQSDRMAEKKLTDWGPLLSHVVIHLLLTASLLVWTVETVTAAKAATAVMVLHFAIDSRRWVSEDAGLFDGYQMAVDQTLHLASLYVVAVVFL